MHCYCPLANRYKYRNSFNIHSQLATVCVRITDQVIGEMDKDFKMYRELITIGQRIKQLKLDKPSNYKKRFVVQGIYVILLEF